MKQLLFEVSNRNSSEEYFNYTFGVWYKTLDNLDDTGMYTDAFGNVGYYEFDYSNLQNVLSVQVNKVEYTRTDNLNDCLATETTFFWDYTTQNLYIHTTGNKRISLFDSVIIGLIYGYANNFNETTKNIYQNVFYRELLNSVGSTNNTVDPIFFGKLKYNSTPIKLNNTDGTFDPWENLNNFNTYARALIAEDPTAYTDFEQIAGGYISDDSRTWTEFSVNLDDPRKRLEQSMATRLITATDFPNAPDGSIDLVRPVAYGKVFARKCICVDNTGDEKFLFVDTLYNQPTSLDAVYIDGVDQIGSVTNIDLNAGTFQLNTSDIDNVYASFTMPITNGVDIIKDLMFNYDGLTYLSSFWDIEEVDAAETRCRDTSLYIADDTQLKKAVESICFDCDLRFFNKDNGKYTIRIYDENRTPSAYIYYDDWDKQTEPTLKNNGSEYLTRATVKYMYREDLDEYTRQYANTDYQETAFDTYKKDKFKPFETGLYTEADAIEKSETVLSLSANIKNIISRDLNWSFKDLQVTDFVYASPFTRISNVQNETLSIYEIIGIQKNLTDFSIKITLRYVKEKPQIYSARTFTNGKEQYYTNSLTDGTQGYNRTFGKTGEI